MVKQVSIKRGEPVRGTSSLRLPRNDDFIVAWVKAAREQGWTVEMAGNGHVNFIRPDGRRRQVSATPSDYRTRKNERSGLRRFGLEV